jgi:hypothetical protein
MTPAVGAADDVEEPPAQLLDEQPVARKEPGVVDADAEREEPAELLAVRCREPPGADDLPDLRALLSRPDLHARERLCELGALALCEIHDVDRALPLREEVLDRLVERRLPVFEVEGTGRSSGGKGHLRGVASIRSAMARVSPSVATAGELRGGRTRTAPAGHAALLVGGSGTRP